ncbi:MAG: hypothetical protein MHMPM18_000105 [Marteilia pararefringens]
MGNTIYERLVEALPNEFIVNCSREAAREAYACKKALIKMGREKFSNLLYSCVNQCHSDKSNFLFNCAEKFPDQCYHLFKKYYFNNLIGNQ